MPKLSTVHSLSDYHQIRITDFKDKLKQVDIPILKLSYIYAKKQYEYTVSIDKTPCNYGGYRYWFICPKCQKRVGVLYENDSFVCRHCIKANYATQLMQPKDRAIKRMNDIRTKLGWQRGIVHGIEEKPKHMQMKTFNKLVTEYLALESYVYERFSKLTNSA